MSVKRSEDYLYFQNKAQHYHNIQTARSRVESQVAASSLRRTIDPSQHLTNRDQPYNQQQEIDFQNKHLAQRILSISTTDRKEVQAQGHYSRFHHFERGFRRKNPFREEEERQISLENEKIRKHITEAKPRVGNNQDWQAEYRHKHDYRRIRSRYEGAKSKGDLTIDREPFLPDSYLKYIDRLSPPPHDQAERASSSRPRHVRLEKEKLFILPSFTPNAELFPERKQKEESPTSVTPAPEASAASK